MPSRVTIYDHFGTPIAELDTYTTRSWVLNGFGRCQWQMATLTDPNCIPAVLQYGNFVMVEHIPTRDEFGNVRGRLPAWAGVILPPREWDYGLVTVTAYGAELLLGYRPMPYVDAPGTAGTIFSQIINYGLSFGGFPVQIGIVYDNSAQTLVPLRLSAYDELVNLSRAFTQDFDVTPGISSNNQLKLFANWYSQKGVNVQAVLSEGIGGNMRLPKLTEQGTLSNIAIGYNVAASAGARLSSQAIDEESGGDYGWLGVNQNFNVNGQAGVDAATQGWVNLNSRPRFTLDLIGLDVGKTFDDIDIGNVWSVVLKSLGFYNGQIGFQAAARITGIEYDDWTNEAKLTTQVLSTGLTEANYA